MATVNEFNAYFIEKLSTLGGWKFSPEQVAFLYEKLKGKPVGILADIAKSIVAQSKAKPSIAQIIDAFPSEVVGIANIKQPEDDRNYRPYPHKFIAEVVNPAMQEYAEGMPMEPWRRAFASATEAWERANGRLDTYPITKDDYVYAQAYFSSVIKAMVAENVGKNYSNRRPKF